MLASDGPLEDVEITDAAPDDQILVLNADLPIFQKFDVVFSMLSSLVILMVVGRLSSAIVAASDQIRTTAEAAFR
jgi:hypothetical protein